MSRSHITIFIIHVSTCPRIFSDIKFKTFQGEVCYPFAG